MWLLVGLGDFRLVVCLARSRAMSRPVVVTAMADSLMLVGIVIV